MISARRLNTTEVAKVVREELKKAYPSLPKNFFSVRSKKYAGGSSISVDWTDGPTVHTVENILNKFEGAQFDGMEDLKTYKGDVVYNGELVHFGVDYINGNRTTTYKLVHAVSEAFSKKYHQGQRVTIETSRHDQSAWVSIYDPLHEDIRRLINECPEDALENLEICISGGRFHVKQPGMLDDEEVYQNALREKQKPKTGMLTRAGALKLRAAQLSGEDVSYREAIDESVLIAKDITHPKLPKGEYVLPIGEAGIVTESLKTGQLTESGAERLGILACTVRYVEKKNDGVLFADDIYYCGKRIGGSMEFGHNGILPKIPARTFLWAARNHHYELIKSMKQEHSPAWIDGIEVFIHDDDGKVLLKFAFSWYDFGDAVEMKLEMGSESFVFLEPHTSLFQKIQGHDEPNFIVDVLKSYGFVEKE